MAVSFWTTTNPAPRRAESTAATVEAAGWDGLTFTDSQNLSGDVYVALGLPARATSRIGLGVTNPVTRHPAATASAIATVQILSEGHAVLGIERGDSALFHLGFEPAPVADFERYLVRVQGSFRGDAVDLDGFASRIRWLGESRRPKVPVDVAATGPRVIAVAAQHADRITRRTRPAIPAPWIPPSWIASRWWGRPPPAWPGSPRWCRRASSGWW
jgi:5,10-methylenetetrahydromethanopterin reductase